MKTISIFISVTMAMTSTSFFITRKAVVATTFWLLLWGTSSSSHIAMARASSHDKKYNSKHLHDDFNFNSNSNSNTHNNNQHDSNVAIILSSSTFFHNYRHTTNALTLYHALKKHGGYTDDNIILFLGDEVACNARNPFKDQIRYTDNKHYGSFTNLWNDNNSNDNNSNSQDQQVQVDYSGKDVTVENFFRVLVGRHDKYTPKHQQIIIPTSAASSNIQTRTNLLIYVTGHGGDNFFKFRDDEDFVTLDLRGIFEQIQITNRFHSILFISDTCQAFTLAPNTGTNVLDDESNNGGSGGLSSLRNVYSVGSSLKGQSSYAHHGDLTIGHSVIDRYMFHFLDYMDSNSRWSNMNDISLKEGLVDSMYYNGDRNSKKLGVDVGYSDFGCDVDMEHVPMSDFFVMKQQYDSATFDDAIATTTATTTATTINTAATLIVDQVDFWK